MWGRARGFLFATTAIFAASSVAVRARADEPSADEQPGESGPAIDAERDELTVAPTAPLEVDSSTHWRAEWRRFHLVEGIITGVAAAGSLIINLAGDQSGNGWFGLLPGEVEIADALRVPDPSDQDVVALASDIVFFALAGAPVLIDALLLAGGIRGDWDTALQLTLIDLETIALTLLLTQMTERLAGRLRPYAYQCQRSGDTTGRCDLDTGSPTSSFVAGHSLAAFAGAGLVCVHNLHNPWILGSEGGAISACVTAMTLATGVGVLRMMADRHWISDVIVGSGLGLAVGWLLPYLAHYSQHTIRAFPVIAEGTTGLAVMGAF